MEKFELVKNSRSDNWLEKLQLDDGEKIGIVNKKILSRKIGEEFYLKNEWNHLPQSKKKFQARTLILKILVGK